MTAVQHVAGVQVGQEGEGHDRTDLLMPGAQDALIKAVLKSATGRVIMVVMSGGPIDLSSYKSDPMVAAILITGYPGQSGGQAIAETLFGDNNPAGKLTQTWYANDFVNECEMIDMNMRPEATPQAPGWPVCPGRSYRFYQGAPVYKFGDGLSYTTFAHTMASGDEHHLSAGAVAAEVERSQYAPHTSPPVVRIQVDVANVGPRDGAQVVLGYVVPAADRAGKNGMPLKSLRRYQRVHVRAGETQRASLEFNAHDFAVADEAGNLAVVPGQWTVEVGDTVATVFLA